MLCFRKNFETIKKENIENKEKVSDLEDTIVSLKKENKENEAERCRLGYENTELKETILNNRRYMKDKKTIELMTGEDILTTFSDYEKFLEDKIEHKNLLKEKSKNKSSEEEKEKNIEEKYFIKGKKEGMEETFRIFKKYILSPKHE